ncbi:DUF84 family protein [Candidatus Halobonum tyrrellensis]|uniref:inosine/xanthosine triphosphatase n=1 Tax=Candidatus Halobonum tyrrellensis G22 TaxID=1324957 RepID=V4HCB9_9EURY|nr:inosine/xanthosine triphosphatase [Candidatus Halobonum tyrrellensis]ESP88315.1 hypothetical protein K933_09337 [Candidatus Halobonum tyrrellensis G22]
MRVGVGSGNPVKVDATERALAVGTDDAGDAADAEAVGVAGAERFRGATVEACPVPSGVPEQPRGRAETRRGAENRAARAFDEGYDLGVGIEGGVAEPTDPAAGAGAGADAGADGDASERTRAPAGGDGSLLLVMWAAVTDGERWGAAAGPSLPLPGAVTRRVRDGAELGPVMDDLLGEEDVARRQGAAGALTGGRVDRADALATAVAGALGPFVTDLYD